MTPEIELVDTPDRTIRDAIVAPLLRFNVQQTGTAETPRPLAITLSDQGSGEIIEALRALRCTNARACISSNAYLSRNEKEFSDDAFASF